MTAVQVRLHSGSDVVVEHELIRTGRFSAVQRGLDRLISSFATFASRFASA
jgi:hypothetical protein